MMAKHKISLVVAIVMALMLFIVTMVFSALAAPGICKFRFHQKRREDADRFEFPSMNDTNAINGVSQCGPATFSF